MSDLKDRMLAAISGDEMWKHLEKLCEWDRTTGTEGEFAAVDYIASVLKSYGLPVTLHEYDAYISHPVSGGLTVTLDGAAVEIPAKTRAFSANTPPEGATGPLVSIQGGTNMFKADNAVNQISPETVGGKIVLSESGSRATMLAAKRNGAIGYIHMWPSDEDVIHEGIVTPVWGTPTPETAGNIPSFPLVSIKHKDGLRLREALAKGDVTATLRSVTTTAWTRVKMPVTHIAGREDDFVLVAGHIDSWHYGATDNATGNVSCLELARVLAKHRDELRRGVRIAWWVGHSTGRYSGSTWYADQSLGRARPPLRRLHQHRLARLSRRHRLLRGLGRARHGGARHGGGVALTGQTPAIDRPMRAGDQSFWGVGVPSLFMLLSNRPEGQRAAVGGCGMGWWWHAEEDLIDKADRDVLLKDTQIYAHALLRLTQDEVLPLDLKAQVAELRGFVEEIAAASAGHFDASSVLSNLDALDGELDTIAALPPAVANETIRKVSHALTPLSFTSGNRFDHDPAMPLPAFPALDAARKLAQLAPGSDEYGFLTTRLVRNRNLVNHEIAAAADICRAASARAAA